MGRGRPSAGGNDEVVEIIEVYIAPGPTRRTPAGDAPERSRPRPAVVVGACLVALALVIGAAATWWPEPDREPTMVERPQRFAVDAPPGWELYATNLLSPADTLSWFGLWAAPGAGRWLLVEIVPAERAQVAALDATRMRVGPFDAASPANQPERRLVEVPLGRVRAIVIASGIDGRELADTVTGMRGPSPGDTAPVVTPPSDLVLVASGPGLEQTLYGERLGEVLYRSADADVTFTFGRSAGGDTAGTVLDIVGRDPGHEALREERDGVVFTVEGAVDQATLSAFLDGVGPVDEATWQEMLSSRRPGLELGQLLQVADGLTTDGQLWTAGVRLATRDGEARFGWAAAPLDTPGGPPFGPRPDSAFPTEPAITSLVVPGATYVFAAIPRSAAVPAVDLPLLRVRVAGGTVDIPFVDLGDELPVLFAAYAFDEPIAFEATVVG